MPEPNPRPLPQLLDCKGLQKELGISRAAAEKIMYRLPIVKFEGLRKLYVRREDVRELIESSTYPAVGLDLRQPR